MEKTCRSLIIEISVCEKNKARFTDALFDYGSHLTARLKLVKLSYRARSKLNWIFIQTYVRR